MIRNVLGVDLHSMKIALKAERGALVLFDSEAAFPSISQEYLLLMLDALGVPSSFTQLVKAFYHDCRCILKVVGATAPGFPMTSGVRQGVLSPHSSLYWSPTSSSVASRGVWMATMSFVRSPMTWP